MWSFRWYFLFLLLSTSMPYPIPPNPYRDHYDPDKEEKVDLKIAIPNINELHVLNLQLFEPLIYKTIENELFLSDLEEQGAKRDPKMKIQWDLDHKALQNDMQSALEPVIDDIASRAELDPEFTMPPESDFAEWVVPQ